MPYQVYENKDNLSILLSKKNGNKKQMGIVSSHMRMTRLAMHVTKRDRISNNVISEREKKE